MNKVAKVKSNSRAGKGKEHDEETLNELKEAFKIFDSKNTGEIDARELKAIMKAFGLDVKKQDVRDIYSELGKEIKEGLSFNEFLGVMTSRMVCGWLHRALGTPRRKSTRSSSSSTRTTSTRSPSKT
jgi:Ca2+-binding EF-hand superfamily protein